MGRWRKNVMDRVLDNKAFTLIEIMLVVILLGILAVVVIPIYWDSQTSARIARAQTDISILNRQLELYNANEANKFPQATITYTRAALIMSNAGYIKDIMRAPEGIRYSFDGNTGRFVYAQIEE